MDAPPRKLDDLVTVRDLVKIAKKLKYIEALIDDAFDKINEVDNRLTQNIDEAIDRASRAQRAVNRLRKELLEEEQ